LKSLQRTSVDALFVSYYEDVDRWHNDHLDDTPAASTTGVRASVAANAEDHSEFSRLVAQSVGIDGGLYDMPRFLSWVAHGTTAEYARYSPFSMTHLSGSYLRALTAGHGFDVRHVNFCNRRSLIGLAEQWEPRWILLSTTFLSETTRLLDACQRVRKLWPDAGLALGGLVILELESSMPEAAFQRLLRACGADAVVLSPQGEEALLALLAHERDGLAGLELPRTWIKGPRGYVRAGERAETGVPFDQAWVRWSRLAPESLYHTVHTRTARSCAFKCAFCTFPQLQGGLDLMSPEAFEQELVELERLGSVRNLIFTDDTFNVPPARFKELCRVLARHEFGWFSFFRPQFSDPETARLMKAAHCRGVFMGIESADNGMLVRMGKPAKIEKVREGIEHVQSVDIPIHANFIIGFPGDVPENTEKIVTFLDETGIDFFYASAWFNSPTAPVSKQAEEYKIEGQYYRWKHATMDSATAIELEKSVQHRPRHAQFASEYTQFTFWGEVLLMANGFTLAETRQAFAAFNANTGRDRPAAELARTPEVVGLRALLARKPLAEPVQLASADLPAGRA
jgi:p-methyltransferase